MALRGRIERLEAAWRRRGAARPRLIDPALVERLVDDPEWRTLVRELYAICLRLMESGCADMVALRQGVLFDDRGREILCLMGEIQCGLRLNHEQA
jgi:hypothetical protein